MRVLFLICAISFLSVSLSSLRAQSSGVSTTAAKAFLSQNISELDENILRRKLERTHGESGRAGKSLWEVAFGGQIYRWEWNGQWSCPSSKDSLDCAAWVPVSLEWFETKNAWLRPWTRLKKERIVLDADRKIPVSGGESSDGATEDSTAVVDEEIKLGGQRLALQAWDWRSDDGRSLRVYTSLRNSRIERIDHGGIEEYIEWKQNPKSKSLQIQQIIFEKSGQRLSARRVESAPAKKK